MMVFVIVVAIVEIVVILLIGYPFVVVCKLVIGVEKVAVEGNYFYCFEYFYYCYRDCPHFVTFITIVYCP